MNNESVDKHNDESPNLPVGGASTMPVTGACCGIRPSKEAMETDFAIDFSQATQFLSKSQDTAQAPSE